VAHVLADHSVTARSPEGWASAESAAAAAHATIEVVAEANQGGKMVKAVFHAADPRLRVKLVHAHTGKSARAEPVSHLFDAGRARLHGRMPELEAQLLGMIAGGGYEGLGHSPDRADAMVWGVSELMRERAEPRVRGGMTGAACGRPARAPRLARTVRWGPADFVSRPPQVLPPPARSACPAARPAASLSAVSLSPCRPS
jgi:hypothetical protein